MALARGPRGPAARGRPAAARSVASALRWPEDLWSRWSSPEAVAARLVWLGVGIAAWLAWTSEQQRAAAVVAACAFSLIETTWTSLVVDGKLSLRVGHTTWMQWWGNVLWTPLLLFAYRAALPTAALRVALMPLNIWALELALGYSFVFLFGRNMAWIYDTDDALFHGNIRLFYAPVWIGLGLAVEAAWDPLLLPAAALVGPRWAAALVGAVPATLLSDALIGWPQIGLKRH